VTWDEIPAAKDTAYYSISIFEKLEDTPQTTIKTY
jgi:hypothetical protein